MSKRLLFVLYISLFTVFLLFLAVTILASAGKTSAVGGMATAVILAILALGTGVGLFIYDPHRFLKSVSFYLLHAGIIIFLIGQLIYALDGYKVTVSLDKNDTATYNRVKMENGEVVELGFELGIKDFTEEKYDDGSPKHYEATITVGRESRSLTVNHPIHYGGYKIYLMGCYDGISQDGEMTKYVTLLIKYDRGEFVSSGGIYLIIIGAFTTSFARPLSRSKRKEVSENG